MKLWDYKNLTSLNSQLKLTFDKILLKTRFNGLKILVNDVLKMSGSSKK